MQRAGSGWNVQDAWICRLARRRRRRNRTCRISHWMRLPKSALIPGLRLALVRGFVELNCKRASSLVKWTRKWRRKLKQQVRSSLARKTEQPKIPRPKPQRAALSSSGSSNPTETSY